MFVHPQLTRTEPIITPVDERRAAASGPSSTPTKVSRGGTAGISKSIRTWPVCPHEALASNKELAAKLGELERKLKGHDQAIAGILDAIRQLMAPPPVPKKRPIGFVSGKEK